MAFARPTCFLREEMRIQAIRSALVVVSSAIVIGDACLKKGKRDKREFFSVKRKGKVLLTFFTGK
jgi:hypothetical protein